MARFCPDGSLLLGQGASTVSVDGVVPSALQGVPAGGWAPLGATEIAGQGDFTIWRLAAIDRVTGVREFLETPDPPLVPQGANTFDAGTTRWAAWTPAGIRDSRGTAWNGAGPPVVSPGDDVVFATNFQNPVALTASFADGGLETIALTQPLSNLAVTGALVNGGAIVYGEGATLKGHFAANPPTIDPIFNLRAWTMPGGRRWLVGNTGYGLVVWEWVPWTSGPVLGYLVSTDGLDFNPDVWSSDDTTLYVGSATNQAESPTSGRKYAIDLSTGLIKKWAWLGDASGGMYVWGLLAPIAVTDVSKDPTPPLVLPTFAPSTVCRWFMVAGRSPSPEDPANIYRLTTLSETPAQQADPRNRGVYLEKTEDIKAAIALCQQHGFLRVARNYDGLTTDTFPLATALWLQDDYALRNTDVGLLPCAEFYPGIQVLQAFATWCQSQGFLCAAWLASYCGVTIPPAQAWTLQQALDSQGAAWAALLGLCEFVLLFCYEVVKNGAIVDGVQAFPAFQQSRAALVKAIQGADIKPIPPHPSTAHPLALSLISGGRL